jgi:hypothetical protein
MEVEVERRVPVVPTKHLTGVGVPAVAAEADDGEDMQVEGQFHGEEGFCDQRERYGEREGYDERWRADYGGGHDMEHGGHGQHEGHDEAEIRGRTGRYQEEDSYHDGEEAQEGMYEADDESCAGRGDFQRANGNFKGEECRVTPTEAERRVGRHAEQTQSEKEADDCEEEEEDDAMEWQSPPPSQDFFFQPSQNTPIYVPCPYELYPKPWYGMK